MRRHCLSFVAIRDDSLVLVLCLGGDFLGVLISGLSIALLVLMYGVCDVGWRLRNWLQRKAETGAFYISPWLSLGSRLIANHPVPIIDHDKIRRELLAK